MTARDDLSREAPGYQMGHRGPFRHFTGGYVEIDPLWRRLRHLFFEPCRTAERGAPWEDCA